MISLCPDNFTSPPTRTQYYRAVFLLRETCLSARALESSTQESSGAFRIVLSCHGSWVNQGDKLSVPLTHSTLFRFRIVVPVFYRRLNVGLRSTPTPYDIARCPDMDLVPYSCHQISNVHDTTVFHPSTVHFQTVKKTQSLHDVETRRKWWLPLLSLLRVGREKAGRHPLHGLFATINIVIASTAAGTVSALHHRIIDIDR